MLLPACARLSSCEAILAPSLLPSVAVSLGAERRVWHCAGESTERSFREIDRICSRRSVAYGSVVRVRSGLAASLGWTHGGV
eukprot:3695104-Prymnesium_polylepis.2